MNKRSKRSVADVIPKTEEESDADSQNEESDVSDSENEATQSMEDDNTSHATLERVDNAPDVKRKRGAAAAALKEKKVEEKRRRKNAKDVAEEEEEDDELVDVVEEDDLPPILKGLGLGGKSRELIQYLQSYVAIHNRIPESLWLKALKPENVVINVTPPSGDKQSKVLNDIQILFKNVPRHKKQTLSFIQMGPMIYEMGKMSGFGFMGGDEEKETLEPAKCKFNMFAEVGSSKYPAESVSRQKGFHLITPLCFEMLQNVVREILYQMFINPEVQKTVKKKQYEGLEDPRPINHPDLQEKLFRIWYNNANKPWEHEDQGVKKTNVQNEVVPLLKMERNSFKQTEQQVHVLPEKYCKNPHKWWNDKKNTVEAKRAIEQTGLEFNRHQFVDANNNLMQKRMSLPLGTEPIRNNTVFQPTIFFRAYSLTLGIYGVKLNFINPVQILDAFRTRVTTSGTYQVPGCKTADELDAEFDNVEDLDSEFGNGEGEDGKSNDQTNSVDNTAGDLKPPA